MENLTQMLETFERLKSSTDQIKKLQTLWPQVQEFFNILNSLFGTESDQKVPSKQVDKDFASLSSKELELMLEHSKKSPKGKGDNKPQRVVKILETINRPCKPAEIKTIYKNMGYDSGEKEVKVNRKVQYYLSFLKKEGDIEQNEEGEYYLPSESTQEELL